MALIHDVTFDSQTRVLSLLDKAGNVISSCEVPSKGDPLTLTATADNSSVKLIKKGTLSNTFEVDKGNGWEDYAFDTVIPLNAGQSCKWRCKSHPTTQTRDVYVKFVMTGTIEASGNCNSMLSSDFEDMTSLAGYSFAFRRLFENCKSLTKAPELPATELSPFCYGSMFYDCESLVKAPELPATYIYDYSYGSMFYNCTRLRKIHVGAQSVQSTFSFERWVHNVNTTGDFYADPNMNYLNGEYGIPVGWERWVYGAEDTGTTTTRYHNGTTETVKVGSSSYGTCYSVQGWAGFKTPAGMHKAGYTLGAQTPLTMYNYDSPVSAYSCDANGDDGFTETMYDVGDGTGYLTIAQQNANGYYLTATPYTGLTLTATVDNSSVKLSNMGTDRSYQVNTGSRWQNYTFGTVINLNSGDKCRWRCTKLTIKDSYNYYTKFVMTGRIEASGNCNSMISSNYENITSLSNKWYVFCNLFEDCTSLTKAPELPATIISSGCYYGMFYGCTSLEEAPALPAITLQQDCYRGMFMGCSNLKEVRISATTTSYNALLGWLANVSATGDFYCDPAATIFPTDSTSGIPKGWTRRDINLLNALTLTATADNSSVKLTKNGTLDNTFEVDTGNGWTAYEFDTVIPLNAGQSCKWRCKSHPTMQSSSNYAQFVMTGTIEASGNCNSMLSSDFEGITSLTGYDYAFMSLFNGCEALTQSPSLPATTLAFSCYSSMFSGCTSLTQAPSLPATTLAQYCYRSMFNGCTSLTQSPSLPATTLAFSCYQSMFSGCTSLTQAPSLPATTLAQSCYQSMFSDCTRLTQSPSLPATTLVQYCYQAMFNRCSKLKEVRIAATTSAPGDTNIWLKDVSATGDFYCDPNANIFTTDSASGIPANWTRHALADYPVTP